jgi:hypothetical protein
MGGSSTQWQSTISTSPARVTRHPAKAHPELIIDADAVLTCAIVLLNDASVSARRKDLILFQHISRIDMQQVGHQRDNSAIAAVALGKSLSVSLTS